MNKILLTCGLFLFSASITNAQAPKPTIMEPVGQVSTTEGVIAVLGPHARKITGSGPVYKDDVLDSGPAQTVKLKFNDGSEIWMAPQTNFTVQEFYVTPTKREALFHLESGSVRALVEKRDEDKVNFMIHTHTAVMGVRGTEFVAETDSTQKTSLYTLDGSVAMGKTLKDLSDAKTSRLVEKGTSSFSTAAHAIPSAPMKFNHEELVARLHKLSPEIAKDVHQRHLNRMSKMKQKREETKEMKKLKRKHHR